VVYTEPVDAGRRIGKYVLDERIAVGGMAEVWAAHVEGREGFVKPVALKLILESFSGDPELERLFVNEARIAARLQHANLVTVFDFDKVGPDAEARARGPLLHRDGAGRGARPAAHLRGGAAGPVTSSPSGSRSTSRARC
jgi:hypothetical protein